jgi:hypothetical protein
VAARWWRGIRNLSFPWMRRTNHWSNCFIIVRSQGRVLCPRRSKLSAVGILAGNAQLTEALYDITDYGRGW